MSYIGNTNTTQAFTPAVDYFSGNASTTAFTLSRPVASVAQVQVVVNNVAQNPSDAYTVSVSLGGGIITFTSAPSAGTNNIYVYYTSPITQVIAPGQSTVGTTQIQNGVTVNFADGTAAAPSITNDGDTNTGIFFPAADTVGVATGGTERMRIDSSGNVGIGTSSPGARVDVRTAALGTALQLSDDTNYGANFIGVSGGLKLAMNGSQTFAIFQSTNERMRIDSSGNLLVNTTSNIGANAKIFAVGSGQGIAVGYGTGSSAYRHLYMNNADATLYFFNDTNYASLSSAGAWTNASDARLKKNIVNIKYGLADVLRLQPRSYQMNDVAGNFVGFVAQELQTVIPEVVSGDPEKQLGVDYGSLVAVAFKAIQEQQALITALTARITALENK